MNDKADFTQGSILKKLIAFMMPVLGALILQAAYGAVDLLVVGRFGSTSGLSAVSTGSQVLNLVTFVVIQFAMGITVLIARYLGEKRPDQIGSVIGGSAVVFTMIAACLFIVTENYDGGELKLGTSDTVLSPKNFPHLESLKGRTLITSDGTTVLGADDKAGIAEILTMIERVQEEKIPHGPLCVAFTPDEEIGTGASHFNVEQFGADYGYTLDGDTEGEIQYENFNACKADFVIKGFNVHPGSSKDTMINASLVAMEINNALPSMETPRGTEDYEGFYHLVSMSGEVAEAELHYIVRDHDKDLFEAKKKTLKLIEKDMNEKWGEGTVTLTISEQYRNMAEIISTCMHLIDNAKKACENADVTPLVLPIRGGTDGCQLSFKGLPCPNLGTGGHAYHGPYEHITVEGMDKSVDVVTELVKLYAE